MKIGCRALGTHNWPTVQLPDGNMSTEFFIREETVCHTVRQSLVSATVSKNWFQPVGCGAQHFLADLLRWHPDGCPGSVREFSNGLFSNGRGALRT